MPRVKSQTAAGEYEEADEAMGGNQGINSERAEGLREIEHAGTAPDVPEREDDDSDEDWEQKVAAGPVRFGVQVLQCLLGFLPEDTYTIAPGTALTEERHMPRVKSQTAAKDYPEHGIAKGDGERAGETPNELKWRPDLGGAAGAEALDWARKNMPCFGYACMRPGNQQDMCFWTVEGKTRFSEGETIWIALCRAIVAFTARNEP